MVLATLTVLAILTASLAAGQTDANATLLASDQASKPYSPGPIVINEVLGKPSNSNASLSQTRDWSIVTATVEWIELANTGDTAVDVSGWTLVRADRAPADGWQLPAGVAVPSKGVMIILCPKNKQVLPPIPAGSNVQVANNLRVGDNGIALYKPDKSLVASTGHLPENVPGVTVGLPQPSATAENAQYTFLEKPTPFAVNSAARPKVGPFLRSIKTQPKGAPTPGSSITVTVKVRRNQAPVTRVTLLTRVNYAAEQQLPMTAEGSAKDAQDEVTYSATLPGTQVAAGSMLRWRVQASDSASGVSLEPNGMEPGEPQYEGVVVPIPGAESIAANGSIPVLYWFTQNASAAITQAGSPSSISFNNLFYDNVHARRRGVTSLVWPKPKLRFSVPDGFIMRPDIPEMTDVLLNSYYYEVGERSYMKEALAYQVMADEGVVAPLNQHIQVYLNGQFYGLYGMIEKIDNNLLERYKLPTSGPLFKSESGELSNLRWDLPPHELPAYYSRSNRKQFTGDWTLLANFTRGLAGGGPGTRSSFLFDAVNLPAVINENAVQTLLLNQDRCTKNFLMYHNPDTQQWIRIPWDVETSFAQDNGLGGAPGPLYCVLACEQWNSPLYCDSEHPQDLGGIKTAWGTVTAVGMNPFQGSAVASTGRRLLQQVPASSTPLPAEGSKPLTFPQSPDWSNPDRVQFGTRSVFGAAGTYNHLTDALLDVAATRAMYLRRLRTLADKYYARGKLREMVDATWSRIKPLAAQDNTLWKQGDGSRGYTQITTEFIPIRGKQLLQTYGPGGSNPLLPSPQDNSQITLAVTAEVANPREQSVVSVSVTAPADQAVDISNWRVTRGDTNWSFPAGTVIPPRLKLHLSPNVAAFRAKVRGSGATEPVFVIQAPRDVVPADGGSSSWSVTDETGRAIRIA